MTYPELQQNRFLKLFFALPVEAQKSFLMANYYVLGPQLQESAIKLLEQMTRKHTGGAGAQPQIGGRQASAVEASERP